MKFLKKNMTDFTLHVFFYSSTDDDAECFDLGHMNDGDCKKVGEYGTISVNYENQKLQFTPLDDDGNVISFFCETPQPSILSLICKLFEGKTTTYKFYLKNENGGSTLKMESKSRSTGRSTSEQTIKYKYK